MCGCNSLYGIRAAAAFRCALDVLPVDIEGSKVSADSSPETKKGMLIATTNARKTAYCLVETRWLRIFKWIMKQEYEANFAQVRDNLII